MSRLTRAWHAWFLADTDVRPLALMRIGVGTIVTSMLVERFDVATEAYSDAGWIPHAAAVQLMDPTHWSLLHALGSPTEVFVLLLLGAIAAACFTLGLFTRPLGVLAFAVLVSVHVRNPAVLYGGDLTGRILLFYLLLAPCGRAYSLDSLRRRRAVLREQLARGVVAHRGAAPATGPVWPVRLLQIQICVIYLMTGFSKSQGHDYGDGTALWYALDNPVYSRFWPWAQPLFAALAPLLAALTVVTLYWELAFAFMVPFRRLRPLALGTGLFVHGGIFVLMMIEWWGPLMMLSYFAFVRGRTLDRIWAKQLRSARAQRWDARLRLSYDPGDAALVRWVAALVSVDLFRLIEVVPDESGRWRLQRRSDGAVIEPDAVPGVLRRALPVFAIVRGSPTPPWIG